MATTQITNDDTDPKLGHDSIIHESESDKTIAVAQNLEAVERYMHDLNFMKEDVEVMILETNDQNNSARLEQVTVNGKTYYFIRGKWRTCPRFVLEVLARAKRESWNFSYKKNSDGSTADINQMHRMLRYPHQYKDKNPKGQAWYDSIRNKAY